MSGKKEFSFKNTPEFEKEETKGVLQTKNKIKTKEKKSRTHKNPNKKYVNLFLEIEEELRDDMKINLITKYKGKFKNQQEFIQEAIKYYMKNVL